MPCRFRTLVIVPYTKFREFTEPRLVLEGEQVDLSTLELLAFRFGLSQLQLVAVPVFAEQLNADVSACVGVVHVASFNTDFVYRFYKMNNS